MNSQERDQINHFLKLLIEFKLPQKDLEAENLIREAVAKQPDAAYLLVQRSLLLEQAVNNAQAKINALQEQLQERQAAPSTSSFLGNDPWAPVSNNSNAVPGASSYQAPVAQTVAGNSAFYRPALTNTGGGFGSSFLGNVATTAAGVVAGSFLLQGIENLVGHHGSGFNQQPVGEQITDNTVVNNYYGDDAGQQDSSSDYLANDDSNSFLDDNDDSDWV